ncbi:hypothetical protein K501DRAFT_333874 [Backusella circina FSU 941]|nr:hypothetical protein K501DRAFT_333874 [Backusella circina FSU 941]
MSICPPVANASPYIEWSLFGTCVYGYRDAASILLGYFSIFCWLNAQIPQMWQNYKYKSADGLSCYLLIFWLAGDLINLYGCYLNNQLSFQKVLGAYFVTTDIILLVQYFYFGKGPNDRKEDVLNLIYSHDQSNDTADEYSSFLGMTEPLEMTKTIEDVVPTSTYGSFGNKSKSTTTFMAILLFGTQVITDGHQSQITAGDSTLTAGWILGWLCATFYLASRFPQIAKNYKRHSVQGLSLALFTFAVCGNLSYALSILLHPGHTRESFMLSLPYMVGSSGTLFLDAIIFGQYLYYTRKTNVNCLA